MEIYFFLQNHELYNQKYKTKLFSVTLLCAMDSKIPSTCLLAMESVASGLFDTKLPMDVCFFFIAKGKIELWGTASNANTFALFDNRIE